MSTLSTRIQILDSLRGIALLGILLINIPYFGLPYQFADNILLNNESGLNYWIWWTMNLGFEGSMRAIFSILFGASALLLINKLNERKRLQSPARIYFMRLLWFLIFGLVNAYILLWTGDILYTYAIAGIFIFPFRKLGPVWLLLTALFILFLLTALISLIAYGENDTRIQGERAIAIEKKTGALTDEQTQARDEWIASRNSNHPDTLIKASREAIKSMDAGYFSLMMGLIGMNIKIQTVQMPSFMFWDALAFFLIGMAFFKWRIITAELSTKFYWVMMICGYGIGLWLGYRYWSSLVGARFDQSLLWDLMPWDLYQAKRLFMSMGHIGLIILLYKKGLFQKAFNLLSKVGQMAFTNYLMQSILGGLIFYGFGLSLFGELERYQLYLIMIGIWIIQIIFSNYWLKHHRYGPLEWLWRTLTYWKRQPQYKI